MSKRRFTPEQRQLLLATEQVAKCSDRAITYSKSFKVLAVKQYLEQGIPARDIFAAAGLTTSLIGQDTARFCLRDWVKIYRSKGEAGLRVEARGRGGGRPKTKGLTEADKIKRLEAEVAYLKAENDFLTKLRAKRAER